MPVEHKGKQWDVDKDGVAILVIPGIPTATTKQIRSKRLDKELARIGKHKERMEANRDAIQVRVDEITQLEIDLTALRATVTAEPAQE